MPQAWSVDIIPFFKLSRSKRRGPHFSFPFFSLVANIPFSFCDWVTYFCNWSSTGVFFDHQSFLILGTEGVFIDPSIIYALLFTQEFCCHFQCGKGCITFTYLSTFSFFLVKEKNFYCKDFTQLQRRKEGQIEIAAVLLLRFCTPWDLLTRKRSQGIISWRIFCDNWAFEVTF